MSSQVHGLECKEMQSFKIKSPLFHSLQLQESHITGTFKITKTNSTLFPLFGERNVNLSVECDNWKCRKYVYGE